jgi:uncharacterized damage-inducible protein DinB
MATTLLEEALEGWRYTREGLVAEFENIPADSFDFRPAPGMRSLADLAIHIVEAGEMMAGELSRPDGNFTRRSVAELLREYATDVGRGRDKAALVDLMRRSHEVGEAKIRKAGELLMLQNIIQFNGLPATRLSWMSHGVAHEEYHRGQTAVYARLLGLVPALTKLIHGA